jgi:hypothetical protein
MGCGLLIVGALLISALYFGPFAVLAWLLVGIVAFAILGAFSE